MKPKKRTPAKNCRLLLVIRDKSALDEHAF